MEYIELGKSGFRVSVIGLGTWQIGTRLWGWEKDYNEFDAIATIREAIDLGINFIDTAEIYGGGRSEEIIGKAIADRRDEVFIATKVWLTNLSYDKVIKAAERGLRRLGTDVIDLYQVHWPNPFVPIEQTMKAMERLVKEGKVRCIGVSNFSVNQLKRAQEALSSEEIVSNQVEYNLLNRKIEKDLLPYARQEKITIIAYSPLARGILTGKYAPGNVPRDLLRRVDILFSSENLKRANKIVEVLREIAERRGKSVSQVALNWLIKEPIVLAIPGAKKPTHVRVNVGAAGWRLTDDEIKKIDEASSSFKPEKLKSYASIPFRLLRFW
ncbi:MAG: aldo/keto reductase [Nitrososphaerota archaeon]|nr:aldo/keto reductase [Aigarchaeota archaeon]MDW8076285.1 aldo/keto reductase [Nitrososphaerota archaeon]